MARDIISAKIYQMVISNSRIKSRYKNEQSVRNAIAKIHKNNHGITMNAATYEFARRKGFSIYRYLSSEDKESLQHLKTTSTTTGVSQPSKSIVQRVKVLEIEPDFKSPFIREANDNARIYPWIYILENGLRSVILEKFDASKDWWNDKQIVAEDIQNYALRIQEAEKKYPWVKQRGDHPIYYVGLFELFKIIEKNWKSHFSTVFQDLELLRIWIKESVPIRNLVAHNVKTRPVEKQTIVKNTDYICRLIEKWHDQDKGT